MRRQIRNLEREIGRLIGKVLSMPYRVNVDIYDILERRFLTYQEITGRDYDFGRAFVYSSDTNIQQPK